MGNTTPRILRATMASTQRCLAHLSRNILNTSIRPAAGRTTAPASIPIQQVRFAIAGKGYKKKDDSASKKKKKTRSTYLTHDLKDAEQFALLDAIRYAQSAHQRRRSNSETCALPTKAHDSQNPPC